MLIVAARIDTIHDWLKAKGITDNSTPAIQSMVPAHHVVALQLISSPDPIRSTPVSLRPRKE